MNRRSFMRCLAAGGLTMIGGSLIYSAAIEPNHFEVVEQLVQLPRLGPGLVGLRIVQISDLHMGPYFGQEKLERVVGLILEQKPDLVFITGDFLVRGEDHRRALADLSAPLGELARRAAVFSVLGNHDFHRSHYFALRSLLYELGISDVTNKIQSYMQKGDILYIVGVGTFSTGDMQLYQVASQTPNESAAVLLAHEPDVARWKNRKFIMQFSGHSHGGQVNLPGRQPLFLPWMAERYPAGLYDLDGFYVYTNRGLGMTTVPIRVNCPPEITVFTLGAI